MSYLRNLPLHVRISLLATLGFVVTFGVMGWLGQQTANVTNQMIMQERLNLARAIALHVDQDLERTFSRLTQVAAFPTINLEDDNLEPEKAELRALYRPEVFSYVFLLDKDGLVLWTEPYLPEAVGAIYPECPRVEESLRTGQPDIACANRSLTPQSPVITVLMPIRNREGSVAGILGAAIDPASPAFTHMLVEVAHEGSTSYIQIVDENGIILSRTGNENLFQRDEHADLFIQLLREKRADIAAYTVSEERKDAFREMIAFAPLSVAPWGVAVEQDESDFMAPVLDARRKMVIASAIILIVVLLATWATTGNIVEPVRKLVAATQRMTGGDLATPVPQYGKDEIGALSRHLETMREHLARWGEELETVVQQRTQRLSLLNHIAHALSTTLDLDALLEIVYQEIKVVIETDAFFIALYDRPAGEMDFRIQVDRTGYEPQARRPLIPGLTAQIIQSRQPIIINDFEQEKSNLPPARLWGTMEAPRSWLGVPLLLGDDVEGVISVQAYRANAYGEAEQELLTTIANAVAVAIEKARLYQETQAQAARLAIINRISVAASSTLDLDDTLNTITRQMVELFAVEHSGILMFNKEKEWGNVVAEYPPRDIAGEHFNVKGYLAAEHIIANQKPLMIGDTLNDPLMANVQDTMRRLGIQSMLIVPLVIKGETIGSIGLDAIKERRIFNQEEIGLAQTIANQVCIAIENARLYTALQVELAERERAENQLQGRMNELERFNRLAMGRELKMAELKERIRQLEAGKGSGS